TLEAERHRHHARPAATFALEEEELVRHAEGRRGYLKKRKQQDDRPALAIDEHRLAGRQALAGKDYALALCAPYAHPPFGVGPLRDHELILPKKPERLEHASELGHSLSQKAAHLVVSVSGTLAGRV